VHPERVASRAITLQRPSISPVLGRQFVYEDVHTCWIYATLAGDYICDTTDQCAFLVEGASIKHLNVNHWHLDRTS
jgi:hypothetical protein